MRIVLLGAPGCGKGTQGHRLAEHYAVPEISTGDLLRAAVEAGTPLGRAAKAVMDAGQLVSDDIVLGVIRERLSRSDTRKGFILDGFPRTVVQAEQLDELLEQLGKPIDLALLIDVDVDVIMQRLLGRRSCVSCGASYNIFYAPPKMDERCDECGGRLKRRSDDNEETIGNRLRVYELQTAPVVGRYREQGRLRVIHGTADIQDVFTAVRKAIEEARPTFGKDRSQAIRRAVTRGVIAQRDAEAEPAPEPPAVAETSPEAPTLRQAQAAGGGARNGKKRARPAAAAATPAVRGTEEKKKVAAKGKVAKVATGKKTVVKRKAASKKNAAASSATPVRKKVAVKKKAAAKKTTGKNKALVKKTLVKKKAAVAKKAVVKKKAPAAKKSAAQRTLLKQKAGTQKRSPAKSKSRSTAKPAVKKKVAVKKQAVARKKPAAKKQTAVKKKSAAAKRPPARKRPAASAASKHRKTAKKNAR